MSWREVPSWRRRTQLSSMVASLPHPGEGLSGWGLSLEASFQKNVVWGKWDRVIPCRANVSQRAQLLLSSHFQVRMLTWLCCSEPQLPKEIAWWAGGTFLCMKKRSVLSTGVSTSEDQRQARNTEQQAVQFTLALYLDQNKPLIWLWQFKSFFFFMNNFTFSTQKRAKSEETKYSEKLNISTWLIQISNEIDKCYCLILLH